jgi:hypothetical protein
VNNINPKYAFWLGVIVLIEQAIGHGSIALTHMVPLAWQPAIIDWSNALQFCGVTIMTYQAGYSSDARGPLAGSVVPKALALLAAFALMSFFTVTDARATDVAKANPFAALATGYPYQTQGVYFGVYSGGGGGSVQGTAVGVNSNSLVTNQIGVGGTVGYAWGVAKSSVFIAAEAMFGWKNFNAGNAGFSLSGPASFEQRIKIGTPLNNFLSLLPNVNLPSAAPFPAMPNGQTVTNVQAYIMGGFHEDDNSLAYNLASFKQWTFAPSVGVGMLGQLPNGVAVDSWVETIFPDKSICAGFTSICANSGQKTMANLAFYF